MWKSLEKVVHRLRAFLIHAHTVDSPGVVGNRFVGLVSFNKILNFFVAPCRRKSAFWPLGVEAPVYIVVTKSDLLEGCVETAASLPPIRLDEAFGWTNPERRFADAQPQSSEIAWDDVCAYVDESIANLSDEGLVAFIIAGRSIDHPDNITGVAMLPRVGNPLLSNQDIANIVAYIKAQQ